MEAIAGWSGSVHSSSGRSILAIDEGFLNDQKAGVRARDLDIEIKPQSLRVGLKGNPAFMNEELFSTVVVKDSLWTLDGGEICIDLKKAFIGETWSSVLKGKGTLNVADVDVEKKQMMLERFQSEHPGFDFSNADFTGAAPDARQFMGGVDYNRINK